jgi:hypothetical protein
MVPGTRCCHRLPSSDSSHAASSAALAVLTTSAVLTFPGLGDGCPSPTPTLGFMPFSPPPPLGCGDSPTCSALRSIPLAPSVPNLTRPPDKLASASRPGHPFSSLVGFVRLSALVLDVAISPDCDAFSALRDLKVLRRMRVRCVLRLSEEAPVTPLGFSSAWVEKVVRYLPHSPRRARLLPSGHGLPSAYASDLSVNCSPHPPAQPLVFSHPDSTPTPDALRCEPPFTVPLPPPKRLKGPRVWFEGPFHRPTLLVSLF